MKYQKDLYNMALKLARFGRSLFPLLVMLASPTIAHASGVKWSTLGTGWDQEVKKLVPVAMLIIAGLGVCFAGVAVISGIQAKRNQRPLEWQVWGVIGGALAVIIPLIILATAGSIGNNQGNADSTMTNLGLQY